MDEPVHVGLSDADRAAVRRLLAAAEITPLAIASYVEIDDAREPDCAVVAAVVAHAALAADIGALWVRVFPGGPSPDDAAARRLATAARQLEGSGVGIAVETHDTRAKGAQVRALLEKVDHPQVGAVWDIQHPWRAGESVAETYRLLRPFIAYVQITDATSVDDPTPPEFGSGVLPLDEVHHVLLAEQYGGWVSLEWASYWYPAAAPFERALRTAGLWFS